MFKQRRALALCMFWIVASPAWAGDGGDYTIHSNTGEVRVRFTALDTQGRRVTQLNPKDVVVVDNEEVIRRFRSFSPASDMPLHVVVLVDVSDSVHGQISFELEMVNEFVRLGSWHREDQVSIVIFGGANVKVLCHLNCRERKISFEDQPVASVTPLYDSLMSAAELLNQTYSGNSRAAIVVLSDGADNFSKAGLREAISAAQAAEASVYTLNSRAKQADCGGDVVLKQIAAETGGIAFAPSQNSAQALNTILDDLREGFVLTYELPQSPSVRHEVRVLPAMNSHLRFRYRQGYEATSAE